MQRTSYSLPAGWPLALFLFGMGLALIIYPKRIIEWNIENHWLKPYLTPVRKDTFSYKLQLWLAVVSMVICGLSFCFAAIFSLSKGSSLVETAAENNVSSG